MNSCFVIDGYKKLIFRKEKDEYIVFDPISLEFYKIIPRLPFKSVFLINLVELGFPVKCLF